MKAFINYKGYLLLILFVFNYSFAKSFPIDSLLQNPVKASSEALPPSLLRSFTGPRSWDMSLNNFYTNTEDKGKVKILPFSMLHQYNSHHPYGWNDGLMIPAKGYQLLMSGGASVKWGPLSIQIKPEVLYAANPGFYENADERAVDRYLTYLSPRTDIPVYYETPSFTKLNLGQTSIRLNAGPLSLGISNENLWWGPGRKNSLLMSNTARGFKHITFNTRRPIQTFIGALEAQLISGRLENTNSLFNSRKTQQWRYLSGMVFNYQPKWVPGLSLGISRVFQMYNTDLVGLSDYFPLLQPFQKNKTNEDSKKRDQLSAVFARLLLPEAQTEIYVEFGRNDHSVDFRDFTMEPEHSRSYLAGFQKIVKLNKLGQFLSISGEITQMSQPPTLFIRNAGTWYVHDKVKHGYTNEGEVLGAGIGPGGNVQTIDFIWNKGFKKLGIQLERYVHNNDYYQKISAGTKGRYGQWVDLSAGLVYGWNFDNLLVNGKIQSIKSYNYLWQSGNYGTTLKNVVNLHAQVGLSYIFKQNKLNEK